MSLIAELKRRNVFRVAFAYAVIAWLLAQVSDVAFDNFGAPDWVPKSVLFVLVLGFPLAVFFAWAFEMTPEGVKLEKDVDRSQSITNKTGQKLNRLIITVLVAAVSMLLVDKFVLQDTPATIAESPVASKIDKSVAVLPFIAMSNGPDDEYFADGLTEEILNSLAQLQDLQVTARTSAFSFKGLDIPVPEIAAKLGVANVVEGSVRRAGDQLRITAQLIRAEDGFHLWSETYERSNKDSFGVQDEIAEKVADALDIVLDDEQLALMRSSGLQNPEAFILFQKAMELYVAAHEFAGAGQVPALAAANALLDQVLILAPEYSPAHASHADYYIHYALTFDGSGEPSVDDAFALAKQDLQNAIRTAARDGNRLSAMLELALISNDWRRMRELFTAAMNSPDCIYPSWWGAMGPLVDPVEGPVALWKRANECDPLGFYNWSNIASLQNGIGNFDAAIDTAIRGLDAVPHRQIANRLVMAYIGAGRFDEALAASQRFIEDPVSRIADRFQILAAQGDEAKALALLDELLAENPEYDRQLIAQVVLGRRDEANRLAAEEDAKPLGILNLLDVVDSCKCGAPFDLGSTPNFARMVEEADLMWPPRRPIEWPLKDW